MMRTSRITRLLIPALLLTVVTVAVAGIASTGAPESSTGAPGERNCTTSGCHDDNTLNNGSALLTVNVGNGSGQYEPGKIYPVTITMAQPGIKRFGFQAVALTEIGDYGVGNFSASDTARTQVLAGSLFFPSRQYMTYTYEGTEARPVGSTQWTFNWKAPVSSVGKINLYVGALCGNDDGTDKGDTAYTRIIPLQPSASSAIEERNQPHLQLDLR